MKVEGCDAVSMSADWLPTNALLKHVGRSARDRFHR
jgi:hypothetical protein